MPRSFTPAEHRLAQRLGVPLKPMHVRPCMGFRNCCTCGACRMQERLIQTHRDAGREPFDHEGKVKPPPRARQPWESRAA